MREALSNFISALSIHGSRTSTALFFFGSPIILSRRARFRDAHGHPGNPAHHLCFLRIREAPNLAWRIGIGDCAQVPFFQFTPATQVTFTELDEVNGAFELRPPNCGFHLPLIPVYLYERSGADERVHRVILEPDI